MRLRRGVVIIGITLVALAATLLLSIKLVRYVARIEERGFWLVAEGHAAEEAGDLERAVDLYGQGLRERGLDPDGRGLALRDRARDLERLRRFDEAEADWSARLEIKPLVPEYYADRGLFYLRRSAYDKALADFAAGKDIDRKKARYLLGEAQVFAARGEHHAAVDRYTAVLALDAANMRVRLDRADAEFRAGLYAEARDDYGKIIARHDVAPPDRKRKASEIAPIYMTRGLASLRLGDYPRAIADFDQVLVMAPKSADALRWRGDAYERSGARARALGDYRDALALNPRDDDAAARVLRTMEGRASR
jgi:tetratricopeptide (TPR) repeat protein